RGVEHVLGNIVERLALEVAGLLLGLGVGVAVAIGQVVEQAVVQGPLDAAQLRLVHVLVGGVAEAMTWVRRTVVHTWNALGGVLRAPAAGSVDLVLAIAPVGGQGGAQPQILFFVGGADLAVPAGLGRQVGVADDHAAPGGGT